MFCWDSWANTQKLAAKSWRFELFYWDYVLGVLALAGMSMASRFDPELGKRDQVMWLAEQARKRLPNASFPAKMYDFIRKEYEINPDKNDWEQTRDLLYRRHTGVTTDGYNYRSWFDAGINFGASLISLCYGEGDFRRTIQVGSPPGLQTCVSMRHTSI